MCGRFVVSWDPVTLAQRFGATLSSELPQKSWNISPTQTIAIMLDGSDGKRRIEPAYWSLIPSWEKTRPLKYPTFNARVESVLEKPTYRESAQHMRAVIPASGYYEWKDRRPRYFHESGKTLLLAGLYTWWRPSDDAPWELTATIITRASAGEPAQFHDRMPLLIKDDLVDDWLSKNVSGSDAIAAVMATSSAESAKLEIHEVKPLKGDSPELIEPMLQQYGPEPLL
jgi:putative SOS response-associated peptidase YedK